MKTAAIISALLILSFNAFGQNKLVTANGNELNVKITKQTSFM